MYKKLSPLRNTNHADLRLLPVTDFSFARGEIVAPIVIDEVPDVAREYPIVFPVGSVLPVALMGVEKGSNAYVSASGQWLANYIPAHVRHYPLAMARIPKSDKSSSDQASSDAVSTPGAAELRYAVLIDVESVAVSKSSGEPIFDAAGQLTPAAKQKIRVMDALQSRIAVTRRIVQSIDAAGLLISRRIRIKKDGQEGLQVAGVRVIDEKALNALDDEAFAKLRATGALTLVYASLLSWANFRQGAIGKSHPLPAPAFSMVDETIPV
jgi:hypothetical protein